MSQYDDTSSLDQIADRMEDQERRLENDQPPRTQGDRRGAAATPGGAQNDTTRLDRQEDRMEDQERRLENGQPPRHLSGGS